MIQTFSPPCSRVSGACFFKVGDPPPGGISRWVSFLGFFLGFSSSGLRPPPKNPWPRPSTWWRSTPSSATRSSGSSTPCCPSASSMRGTASGTSARVAGPGCTECWCAATCEKFAKWNMQVNSKQFELCWDHCYKATHHSITCVPPRFCSPTAYLSNNVFAFRQFPVFVSQRNLPSFRPRHPCLCLCRKFLTPNALISAVYPVGKR